MDEDLHDAVTRWLEVNAERVEKLAALEGTPPAKYLIDALEDTVRLGELPWRALAQTGDPMRSPLRAPRLAGRNETDVRDPQGRI